MAFYTADYSEVDPMLYAWAQRHSLKIRTEYKDYDVRSIDVAGDSGKLYQLWIDPPDKMEKVGIHAWDYKKRKADIQSPLSEMDKNLEVIYSTVMSWDEDFANELAKHR